MSNIGSWMQTVALGVLVTSRTHDPAWTGLVAAAAFIPMGLLAPFGGVLADRLDRRRWLIVTTLFEMLFATVLAVLSATGTDRPQPVVAVAFLGGCAAAIGFPSYQAMLPDLVPHEDLLGAVSLSSAQFNLGRVIGPALAGLTLLQGGYTFTFAVNAASFAAVVVALLLIRLARPTAPTAVVGVWARMVGGARAAFSEPGCRSAIVLISVVALLASPFIALVPAMAIDVLGRRGAATSILVTAQGIGAVAGALLLPGLAVTVGRRRTVVAALVVLPLLLVAYGLSPSLWVAAVAMVLVGGAYIGVLIGLNTVVQLRAPAAARGRVLSIYMLGLGVVYPIGALLQGAAASRVGLREVTVATALALLAVLAVVAVAAPSTFTSLGGPGSAPAPDPAPAPDSATAAAPDSAPAEVPDAASPGGVPPATG